MATCSSSSPICTNDPTPCSLETPIRLLDYMRAADRSSFVNLAAGVPSDSTLPLKQLEAATMAAYKEEGIRMLRYQTPEGEFELRQILADGLRARGANVNPEKMIITTGCTQALNLMIRLWTKPGDIVACEAPCYYGALELLGQAGAQILQLPTDPKTGLLLDQAERLLKKHKPVFLLLCTTLSNPSGATIPLDNRKALVEMCRHLGVKILEDDIYATLYDQGPPKPLIGFDDGSLVAYATSFSKSIAPGLRIGCVLPGDSFEDCALIKCQQDIHSSAISQSILKHFLKQNAFHSHLTNLRKNYAHRRQIGMQAIREYFPQGTEVDDPQGSFLVWVKLSRKLDLQEVQKQAHQHNIIFCRGDIFFAQKPSQSYMRLNCAKASEEDLVHALKKMGQIISELS